MKQLVLLFAIFALVGCSTLKQAELDAINCMKDPVCYEMAKDRSELYKGIAGTVNPIAGGGVGATILAIGLWLGGRKKRKENEQPSLNIPINIPSH